MPGDELRRVDWKATARLQKLMVKQFHQDSGGAVNLVYDLKTAGQVTRDEAAAEFLTLATMLTAQATPYTITLVDEQNRLQTTKFRDTRTALLKAVKTILETVEFDHGILYELVEPQNVRDAHASENNRPNGRRENTKAARGRGHNRSHMPLRRPYMANEHPRHAQSQ